MAKITLVDIGYKASTPIKILGKHTKNCQAINHTKPVSLPPLIIYANFKNV